MKSFLLLSISLIFFINCNIVIPKREFIGVWINQSEKCKIQLNKDFTFVSYNLPWDVETKLHFIKFNKDDEYPIVWQGFWTVENNQIKLIDEKGCFYYLNIDSFFYFLHQLSLNVKLLEEVGGDMIVFNRQ
jgi:hypothetical protein